MRDASKQLGSPKKQGYLADGLNQSLPFEIVSILSFRVAAAPKRDTHRVCYDDAAKSHHQQRADCDPALARHLSRGRAGAAMCDGGGREITAACILRPPPAARRL